MMQYAKEWGLSEDQVTELKVMQQRPKIDVLTNILQLEKIAHHGH